MLPALRAQRHGVGGGLGDPARGEQSLPPPLLQTARLRLGHPEMSLEELGRLCDPPVGKSGVNHRLRRLEQMAAELEEAPG